MPIGTFLDSFPTPLFVGAHVLFMAIGVLAWRRTTGAKQRFAPAVWLYVASQVVFLLFFARGITMKMGVLSEQTLVVIMMLAITRRRPQSAM